jgi:Tfp pilus assembly protein PilV
VSGRRVAGRSRRALARRLRSSQAGETLIETLMTVAIMGIAFTAVFGAIWTSIRIADSASKTSKADTLVRAFAEDMKQRDGDAAYVPCTTAGGTVTYLAWPVPQEYRNPTTGVVQYTATVTKIRYLSGYSSGVPQWSNTCPAHDLGAQELTLTATGPITDPSVRGTESVTITKRDATGDV